MSTKMIFYSNKFISVKCCLLLIFGCTFCDCYLKMIIEDKDLCSPITKRRLQLEKKGADSAMLITATRLRDHSLAWTSDFYCKFEVKAQKHSGIFVVIQELSLRKNNTSGECIDYVQFKKQDGSTSKKFCDAFNAEIKMDLIFAHKPENIGGPITDNSYIDEKGDMDVRISISKQALRSSEEMNLKIALTSFRDCRFRYENDVPCGGPFKDVCISGEFINDEVYNCPYYDCVDEGGCHQKTLVFKKESLGNKVLIASLSSLLITFVLFICCLWLCRVQKCLCWSHNFANSNQPQAPQRERTRPIELNEQSSPRPTVPTTSTALPEEEDKDLPPSYDSLFPSR